MKEKVNEEILTLIKLRHPNPYRSPYAFVDSLPIEVLNAWNNNYKIKGELYLNLSYDKKIDVIITLLIEYYENTVQANVLKEKYVYVFINNLRYLDLVSYISKLLNERISWTMAKSGFSCGSLSTGRDFSKRDWISLDQWMTTSISG